MNQPSTPRQALWVERIDGLDGCGLWVVCPGGPATLLTPQVAQWRTAAERIMAERAEVASYSIATPDPVTFLSGRTAELIGISAADDKSFCSAARLEHWMKTATYKGLLHYPLNADPLPAETPAAISVGIDAAWLSETEGGSQVVVFEMIRELARRPAIDRIVLISGSGELPRAFSGIGKISGLAWPTALANGTPLVDIMHRPYQPGADVDYRRYHQVARCVALTVLDFIAFDNPAYHESTWSWHRYQEAFAENVALADCVFAISRYVGARLEQQLAHQLSGPVRTTLLGTDHLSKSVEATTSLGLPLQLVPDAGAPAGHPKEGLPPPLAAIGPAISALEGARFLLVLGNDFEHKNRDFAVRVFADMCDRGYDGRLVLAGFHLDLGSSFGHELSGAGRHAEKIVRLASVSNADKVWLLGHAQAVLYPTSAEGFGLVPFEAAALGTPTAFVKFGPLCETLPGVEACAAWQVRPFADHVFGLLEHPDAQVSQIRAAGTALTWSSHVDQVLAGYQDLLSPGAPWRTRARVVPGRQDRLRRTVNAFDYRVRNKLRRLAGKTS